MENRHYSFAKEQKIGLPGEDAENSPPSVYIICESLIPPIVLTPCDP